MITSILLSAALPLVPYPREVTELGGSVRDPEVVSHTDAALSAEGYRLRVADGKAEVFSATEAGAFYARQTLAQLKDADGSFPCVEIADAPAYRWRGLMLDEGRHFFGKETVKELLDLMAMHKLNVFRWIQPETGVKAAADGFEVLQTPFRETYYSCPQGLEDDPFPYRSRHRLPLEKAYRFDPGRGVAEIARKNVLGSECCLWTEMIWNEFDLAWKTWPRACAFAEALWTDPQPRDYEGFARRMAVHRIRLLKRHVNCAPLE